MAISKTAKGVSFDMARFTQNKSDEVALGNMSVNARGDVLGKGGKIEVKREEIIRDYYREEPATSIEAPLSSIAPTAPTPDVFETSEALAPAVESAPEPEEEPAIAIADEEVKPARKKKSPTTRK